MGPNGVKYHDVFFNLNNAPRSREMIFANTKSIFKFSCHGVSISGNTRTRNSEGKFLVHPICRFFKISYFTNV